MKEERKRRKKKRKETYTLQKDLVKKTINENRKKTNKPLETTLDY